ncbi:hypothetical protein LCGC14_2053530, partial [marine sediment metagenome]
MMDKQGVKALLEVFTAPVVYHASGGWENSLPKEMKETRVLAQRLELLQQGAWDKATNAEVCCYLFTASLEAPLSRDWTEIYLFVAAQEMPQVRQATGMNIPEKLSNYQESELLGLRVKIRESQKKRRKELMKDKIKVVIEEGEGKTLVAVCKDGVTDPFMKVEAKDFDTFLGECLGLKPIVEEAKTK